MEVGRTGAIGGVEYVEIAFHDSLLGAFPSGMDGRDDMMGVIPEEDGNAVGGADTDAEVGKMGGKGVDAVEGKGLFQRVFVDEGIVNIECASVVRLVQRHEQAGEGDGNTAISCGGEGGDV